MRILALNHTGLVSGAERSLLELLRGLPVEVAALLASPQGPLADTAAAEGIPVTTIQEIEGSLRLHPVHTTQAMAGIAKGARDLLSIARAAKADVVHANSTRAGLIAAVAHRLGGPPIVVHVRDRLPPSRAATITRRLLCRDASVIVANSCYTAEAFHQRLHPQRLRVIANPVDPVRFDPCRISRTRARDHLGVQPNIPLLGVVAQLSPWKAQDDAIRTLARLRSHWPAARLLIVGEAKFTRAATRYDNAAYARMLHDLVATLELKQSVSFLGEREDTPEIMRALDMLLVPSWEEPFGRTVIESMAMETPVVATTVGGPAEIVADGETGLLLPPRDPQRWAEAIDVLLKDPARRERMASAARRSVIDRFTPQVHVDQMMQAFAEAAAGSGK